MNLMLQRILFRRTSHHLRQYCLNQFNKLSSDSKKDDTSEQLSKVEDPLPSSEKFKQLLNEAATFSDASDRSWASSPYPKDAKIPENQKPSIDPKDATVFMFPGQGTLTVGRVQNYLKYPAAKELFGIAKEVLDYDLLRLCLNGPQDKLNRTEFNQAATVVCSLAALEKVREEDPKAFERCAVALGYSVGEITSLIFSGIVTFEDGLRLTWARGKAMQMASERVPQGMLSVSCTRTSKVGLACEDAKKWATDLGIENPVCSIAIYMNTERKILAGNTQALEYIERYKQKYGLINVNRLPVSGAFHTSLMDPALKSISKTLALIEINEPRCTVYSNYLGKPYSNLRLAKKLIMKQVVKPVKWEQCMHDVYQRPASVSFPQTYDVCSEGRMKLILKLNNLKASRSCIAV